MGLAIETIGFAATNPGAAPAAGNAVLNQGNSATIRNFGASAKAFIDFISRQGAAEGFVEMRSPLFHDNVRGLHLVTTETPAVMLLPPEIGQPVQPGDATTITVSGGAAEVDGGAASIYYTDLPGADAKLKNWDEIKNLVLSIKPVEIDFNTAAAALAWADTALTTTENLLKADRAYAVLGYFTDVAVAALGILGAETANLRIAGPGGTSTFRTDDYFVYMNQKHGRPYIPCFSGNNKAAIFVSCAAVAVGAAIKATLILAELDPSYNP